MSGSNTMCVATVLLETGMVPMQEPITKLLLEAPAGLIEVECRCRDGNRSRQWGRRSTSVHRGCAIWCLNE